MEIPAGAKRIDFPSSTVWVDEDGIFYSSGKPAPPEGRKDEEIRNEMEAFKSYIGNQKVCIILESNNSKTTPSKEQREIISSELNSVVKALAIVSNSPLSRMAANLFFSFKPPQYPMKLFSNAADAKNWIKQYV